MEQQQPPRKKQRRNPKEKKVRTPVPMQAPVLNSDISVNEIHANEISANNTNIPNTNLYDSSLILDQDYEYELSLIADMEKQERIELEYMQEVAKMEALVFAAEIENRNFHIKQVLRKIKIGSGTHLQDKIYISILESWMDNDKLFIRTEHADSFHSFLETNIRISKDTIDYMKKHIDM